jgi:hypothetical protein
VDPYDKFVTETEVYFLEVVKHTPRLEYKVTLQGYEKTAQIYIGILIRYSCDSA